MIVDIQNAKIGIVIVNYNGSSDTKECLDSLRNMTTPVGVIVVDNASSEDDYCQLKKISTDCMLIRSDSNLGFAGGNNIAIRYMVDLYNIETIMLLNNDTVVEPNIIKELNKYSKNNTIVVPKMLYYGKKDYIWYGGGNFNKITGRAIHDRMGEKNYNDCVVKECTFATGCALLMKKAVVTKIGLLDEKYFMYCEDSEFCLRAIENDIKIVYNPKAVLYHKVSKSTGGGESPFCLYYMTRNRLQYLKDHGSLFYPTAPIFTVLTRVIRIVQYIITDRQKSKAILKGLQDYKKGIRGQAF